MIEHATWRVDVVEGAQPATDSRGAAPLVHSEWMRLLLGEFLAPVRVSGGPEAPRVEYLIPGCEEVSKAPEALREAMRVAVSSDMARLRASLADHRARIQEAAEQPERFDGVLFLDAYELLMATTVSDDPAHWLLTDEGLCVTRWGLAEGPRQRPLLAWSDADVGRMQAEIEHRLGQLPPATAPDLGPKVTWDALRAAQLQEARRASDSRGRRTPAPPAAPSGALPTAAPSLTAVQRARALREWTIIGSATFVSLALLVWALLAGRGRAQAESEAAALRSEIERKRTELDRERKNVGSLQNRVNEQEHQIAELQKRQQAVPDGARSGGGSN